MQGEQRERWQELCERAAVEQDAEKLRELIAEINKLLSEKYERIDCGASKKPKDKSDSAPSGA